MKSGITDFLTGTAGFKGSGAGSTSPLLTR